MLSASNPYMGVLLTNYTGFFSGVPTAHSLHGRDEGAARDHRYQGQQDWSHECKLSIFWERSSSIINSLFP